MISSPITVYVTLPQLSEQAPFGKKKRSPSLVFLTLFSSFSFHLLVSLPFCLFLSACMKMTSSVESKETPHKAITNKPDVQAPPFSGIEWGQVPFSKNEFSNFS